jgi:arsenate reductase
MARAISAPHSEPDLDISMDMRLFHNPNCSKSRGALALLRERGIEPSVVAYLDEAPSVEELRHLVAMLGTGARALLRTGEPEYTALGLADPLLDDDTLLAAMHAHPRLIERPVFVHDGRAVIGRPPERVLELLR